MNAQSLINKVDELVALTECEKPDIIGITETWANDNINQAEIELLGYKMYREDRTDTGNGRGGGAILYIKENLTSIRLEEYVGGIGYNIVCCELSTVEKSVKSIVIGLVYRSPNIGNDSNIKLNEIIEKMGRRHLILMGDFNYPNICWDTLTAGRNSKGFLEVTQDSFLTQHVVEPTRGSNILDLVFSSEEGMINTVLHVGRLGASDHDTLTFDLILKTESNQSSFIVPDFKKADWIKFRQDLDGINWESELTDLNVERAWAFFKNSVSELSRKYIPMRKVRNKNRPLWLNQNTLRIIRKKRKLWGTYLA